MRTAKSVRIALTLLGALGLVAGLSVTVLAGPPKPSYSLSIPTQTVNQPSSGYTVADFAVTIVAGSGGYADPVALNYKGLPPGTSASWDETPAVVQIDGEPTYDDTRHLYVQVPSTLKVGTYQFTVHSVNANTGKDAHDTQVTLGVAAPVSTSNTFSLGVNPTAQAIQQGQTASYTVTLNLNTGYTGGPVALSVGGLPPGVKGAFSPTSLSTSGTNSTLTVPTTTKTRTGQLNLNITGTSGKTHANVMATLTIQRLGNNAGFTLAASPTQQQVAAGGTTSFAVGISRNGFTDPVSLSVSGLPTAATATWDADPPTYIGTEATLTIVTDAVYTPDGNFNLTITGTSGSLTQTAPAKLVVSTPNGKSVGISGDASGVLDPGAGPRLIDVQLSNPNPQNLWITNMTVGITGTDTAGCDASNFTITQFSGSYPLSVSKRSTTSLSALGIDQGQWPTITMLNNGDQHLCEGAHVQLAYTATARQAP